jgi:sugar phosphate isomerase/epimerase
MTRFGLSTTVFGNTRPGTREFDLAATHGFTLVELSAGPGRLNLRDLAQIAETRAQATAAGLEVGSVSVALADVPLALPGTADLGCPVIVALAGACSSHGGSQPPAPHGGALRRVIEQMADDAAERNIRLVVEFPATLSAEAIVDLIEACEGAPVGVCLDMGHAHMAGDAADTIETLSGYIATTHLHDNNGREDSHRPPFAGSVDWPATLMAMWKTGYSGHGIVELAAAVDTSAAIGRAVGARTRLQAILDDLAQPMAFPE